MVEHFPGAVYAGPTANNNNPCYDAPADEAETLLRRAYALLLDAIDPHKGRTAAGWMTEEQLDVLDDINGWLLKRADQ